MRREVKLIDHIFRHLNIQLDIYVYLGVFSATQIIPTSSNTLRVFFFAAVKVAQKLWVKLLL